MGTNPTITTVNSPPLQAPRNTNGTVNGVYSYAGTPTFPTDTFKATNYWVDVIFQTATGLLRRQRQQRQLHQLQQPQLRQLQQPQLRLPQQLRYGDSYATAAPATPTATATATPTRYYSSDCPNKPRRSHLYG